jgi:hypothetical protein
MFYHTRFGNEKSPQIDKKSFGVNYDDISANRNGCILLPSIWQ